jgi:CRISPR system Cascade subunit CasC
MTTQNPFKNIRIEFHILQSFPVTCLNRDDVGAPKTAIVGGVTRARVSSQCWKRQVRLAMQDFGVKLGIRTKQVAHYVATACQAQGATEEQAEKCGEAVAVALTKDTLHFFTDREAQAFAAFAAENEFDEKAIKPKDIQKLSKKVFNAAVDGLDIALFGRMVAQAAELNIEAAASFSHAISTHAVNNEVEFFTAIDDTPIKLGSGHMGSLEYNSATYYRYISLDLGQLWHNLGGNTQEDTSALRNAIDAFTKALFVAVPSARQTTQSGASSWDYAQVLVRKGQRLQANFDQPVAKNHGFSAPSIQALKNDLEKKEKMCGSLYGKIAGYELGGESPTNIDDLCAALRNIADQ